MWLVSFWCALPNGFDRQLHNIYSLPVPPVSGRSSAPSHAAAEEAYIPVYAIYINCPRVPVSLIHYPHRQRRPATLHAGPAPVLAGRLRRQRHDCHGIRSRAWSALLDIYRMAAQAPRARQPARCIKPGICRGVV